MNFIAETLAWVADKEVKEVYIKDLDFRKTYRSKGIKALMRIKNPIYDSGFGLQRFNGWVSFTDGTWIERAEYDGSEWWEFKQYPRLELEEQGDEND